MRFTSCTFLCLVLLLSSAPVASAGQPGTSRGVGQEDGIEIAATQTDEDDRGSGKKHRSDKAPKQPPKTVTRRPACGRNGPEGALSDDFCRASTSACPPGQTLTTTWTQVAGQTRWTNEGTRCTSDAPAAEPVVIPAVTVSDLRRVDLPPSPVLLQPGTGQALLNVPLVLRTSGGTVTRDTTVLGFPVTIRATPVSWTWDLGDGAHLGPTGDPGRAYPHQTLTHAYTEPGDRPITLTTTWAGEYTIAGLPYRPIEGTATTTSPGVGVHVLSGGNVLVAEEG